MFITSAYNVHTFAVLFVHLVCLVNHIVVYILAAITLLNLIYFFKFSGLFLTGTKQCFQSSYFLLICCFLLFVCFVILICLFDRGDALRFDGDQNHLIIANAMDFFMIGVSNLSLDACYINLNNVIEEFRCCRNIIATTRMHVMEWDDLYSATFLFNIKLKCGLKYILRS